MPARDTERKEATAEAEAEVQPPEPSASNTEFSQDGELPAVAEAAAAPPLATASELAFDGQDKQASADLSHLDRGIHHWEDYKAACEAAGKPEKWQAHWRAGHTEASGWRQPYEDKADNDWALEHGHSASQAIQDFIKGPTIADYRAAAVADELDELRDEMGDQKFDQLFGSANSGVDAAIPKAQRLRVSAAAYTTPLVDQMKAIAREHDERAHQPEAEAEAPVVEARVEEKPKEALAQEQDPLVVAQELNLQQQDRELV